MRSSDLIFVVLFLLIPFAFFVVMVVSLWKLYEKMGDPGWAGIIPVFNYYRLFIRSRPEQAVAWTIGSFFCFIGGIVAMVDLATLFGKDAAYAIGLIFLPFVFMPMLAFGSATYQGPAAPAL